MYVSGAPDLLYGDKLPEELTGDPDAILSEKFGVTLSTKVYDQAQYTWPPSAAAFPQASDFTSGLTGFYQHLSRKNVNAAALLKINDCIICENVIYCKGDDGFRPLYETHRPTDRAVDNLIDLKEVGVISDPRFEGRSDTYFYLGSAGSANYGHWLVDDLPRLKAAHHLARQTRKRLKIVMPHHDAVMNSVRTDGVFRILDDAADVIFIDRHKPVKVSNLHYCTPVSDHPISKSPAAIDYAVQMALRGQIEALPVAARRGDRIFVKRSTGGGRNLTNQDEVAQALSGLDFAIIDDTDINFRRQIEIYSSASLVVGQMGAAMTNTMFCRPTTKIIHLAPLGWIEPFYWDLAAVRGHTYRALYGNVTIERDEPHKHDFSIDIESLLSILNSF